MKKRLTFPIIFIILFCATFLIYNRYQYNEKSITEVIKLKENDITKIVLSDSRNSMWSSTIEDKQKMNEFFKLMDSDVIKKEKEQPISNGWLDYVDFYVNKKKVKALIFTNDIQIGHEYYKIIKGDLTCKKIIESINPTNSKN